MGEQDGRKNGSALFTGPRGTITMNGLTHSTAGPVYLQELQQKGNVFQNEVVTQLKPPTEQEAQVAALRASEKTGWLDTYLCN